MALSVLRGPFALSVGKENALLAQLQQTSAAAKAAVVDVTGHFVHYVTLRQEGKLSEADQAVLDRLLVYGPPRAPKATTASDAATTSTTTTLRIHVLPRPGTRSPWSSKASDIVVACGLGGAVQRIERGTTFELTVASTSPFSKEDLDKLTALLHDRMTQVVHVGNDLPENLVQLSSSPPATAAAGVKSVVLGASDRRKVLEEVNKSMGLALSGDELTYLAASYETLNRDPTDVELMMFAQVNSEHCRHKVFRAKWTVQGKEEEHSLFDMIRITHATHPNKVLSAYSDNGAVLAGPTVPRLFAHGTAPTTSSLAKSYSYNTEQTNVVIKVETHNHPTAVSPFPGAATGSGGEIRDEGAVGVGAVPKAGLVGFAVSDLQIPGYKQPWELDVGKPGRIASAFDIMIEAPLGAAAFNNEFGRPSICGFFRTLTTSVQRAEQADPEVRGYHKPIMIAGGLGAIRPMHTFKRNLQAGDAIVVLGGPAMLIGLGGGAASSVASGTSSADLDFASVQRDNAEMQRRCQEVINQCWALGDNNPIISIHDVGAGGLSNALPEIVEGSEGNLGAVFDLRAVPSDDPSLSPLEIWCNEAQERYVMAVRTESLEYILSLCKRERALVAVVGKVTSNPQLVLEDKAHPSLPLPIDLPMSILFGKTPRMHRVATPAALLVSSANAWWSPVSLKDAVYRVLNIPSVASKSFLITIGDRTVGGQIARDQFVGPWQTPVADVGVTTSSFQSYHGEAMSMGERTPLALISAAASVRMAVGEALTNMLAADVDEKLFDVALSANWMVSAGHPGEDLALFEGVRAVSVELCVSLGIPIPVGKDSMSMKTSWTPEGASKKQEVTAPLSLIVSAFALVDDVRLTLTPQLHPHATLASPLVLFDLSGGQHKALAAGTAAPRLAGSAFAQAYQHLIDTAAPDFEDPKLFLSFASVVRKAARNGWIVAYHDRSDGGLLTTVAEMAFAARTSVHVDLGNSLASPDVVLPLLFNEELGVVVQVHAEHVAEFSALVQSHASLAQNTITIGEVPAASSASKLHAPRHTPARVQVLASGSLVLDEGVTDLLVAWSETSYRMQALRDNADCAKEEFEGLHDVNNPGLSYQLTYDLASVSAAPAKPLPELPRVVILREEGVNGQMEMAASFLAAGFEPVDIHMTDIITGAVKLDSFRGLAACGGFSYGDVLGAGEGWAKSILFNANARSEFERFFNRKDTFTLGVCNGCQMLSSLKELVPGAELWPRFVRNRSEQYESRVCTVEVVGETSKSVLLAGMEGSKIPIAVAHGEGQAKWSADPVENAAKAQKLIDAGCVVLQYVDNYGHQAQKHPYNPNGAVASIAGICSLDGRVTIMMPHPERVARWVVNSWFPASLRPDGGAAAPQHGPWQKIFSLARNFVGNN